MARELFACHEPGRTLHCNFLKLEQTAPSRVPAMSDHLCSVAGALQAEFPALGAASRRAHAEVIASAGYTLIHSMISGGGRDKDLVEHFDAFIGAYLRPLQRRA